MDEVSCLKTRVNMLLIYAMTLLFVVEQTLDLATLLVQNVQFEASLKDSRTNSEWPQ